MRYSRQRELILAELRKLRCHPSAAELYEIVRREMPSISLGTVYRNLNQLAEAGAVLRLAGGDGEARFDGDVSPHLHVRCVRCGRVGDMHGARIEDPREGVQAPEGFEIIGCQVEFLGICDQCSGPGAGASEHG